MRTTSNTREFFGIILILMLIFLGCRNNSTENQNNNTTKKLNGTVYYDGDIITMEGDSVQYVEAVVVNDGKIVFVGSKDEAFKTAGEGYEMIDLKGQTMLPGFIDAHGHVFAAGIQALAANLLPPPDGNGASVSDLVKLTKDWADNNGYFYYYNNLKRG